MGQQLRAIAEFPARQGLPEARLRLVEQSAGQWKLDLPAGLDMTQLRSRLDQQVRQLNQSQASWPDDRQEAALLVAQHALSALSASETGDRDAVEGQGASGRGGGALR
jgi:hypothetical protein